MNSTTTHHIACIGGGTGLFTILTGLKEALPDTRLSAVVTMMDSGGSTGKLRTEYGLLPPGDIRQCLVALSDAPEELTSLMAYRFKEGEGLSGHSLGNLMLTAAKMISSGSREDREFAAINMLERILHIPKHRKVYPVTLTDCHLSALLSNGQVIKGEMNIDVPKHDPNLRIRKLYLEPDATVFQETRKTIVESDVIIIGPGDLYTSIIPNLIVEGVTDAIREAQLQGTKVIYVVNTMTKFGESTGFKADDFVEEIEAALQGGKIDALILNTTPPNRQQLGRYRLEESFPVEDNLKDDRLVMRGNFISTNEFARHDPHKLAQAIIDVIKKMEEPYVRHHSL